MDCRACISAKSVVHRMLAAVCLLTRCAVRCSSAILVALHLAAAAAQIPSCAPTCCLNIRRMLSVSNSC